MTQTTFDAIAGALEGQAIELPSWAFGNLGTRFKVFAKAGVPRDPYEKVAETAQVNLHSTSPASRARPTC